MKHLKDYRQTLKTAKIIGLLTAAIFAWAIFVGFNQSQAQQRIETTDGKSGSVNCEAANAATLATANRAFDRWKRGLEKLDMKEFVEMMTEDVKFTVPIGKYRGVNNGRKRMTEVYDQFKGSQAKLRVVGTPRVASAGNTVVFELEDTGTIGGKEYRQDIVLAFDVRGEQISAYREYVGDISPTFISLAESAGK